MSDKDCPRWKRFLAECISEPKVIAELREFFGRSLEGVK